MSTAFVPMAALALAPDDLLNNCLPTIKQELHSKSTLPLVRVSSCNQGQSQSPVICHGYASSKDGISTDDFVFGLRDDCKLSFYRVTAE